MQIWHHKIYQMNKHRKHSQHKTRNQCSTARINAPLQLVNPVQQYLTAAANLPCWGQDSFYY